MLWSSTTSLAKLTLPLPLLDCIFSFTQTLYIELMARHRLYSLRGECVPNPSSSLYKAILQPIGYRDPVPLCNRLQRPNCNNQSDSRAFCQRCRVFDLVRLPLVRISQETNLSLTTSSLIAQRSLLLPTRGRPSNNQIRLSRHRRKSSWLHAPCTNGAT